VSSSRGRRSATIGVDVGTSGCKAVLLDDAGNVHETSVVTYPTRRGLDGEVSQEPRDWLQATAAVLRECAAAAAGRRIEALSVTAPAHVGVLIGPDGAPLARALLAWDARPASVLGPLRARFGTTYFDRTLVELSTGWTFPQVVWLRGQLGRDWVGLRHLLTQKDYIRFAMTGAAAIDPTDAQGTGLFDPRTGAWLGDLAREAGLLEAQLPPIVASKSVGGALSRAWARRTGLPPGIPVCVGATDTAAELVSVGGIYAGFSLVKIASTGTVVVVSEEPKPDRRILTYPHAVPGLWYHLGATNTAALSYTWLRETVFAHDPGRPSDVYAEMDRVASRVPPGAGGLLFLPFLEGERTPYWDPRLRGALIGLSTAHRREHLCRAVLEGVAFSLRTCRDLFLEIGFPVVKPQLGGGGSASRLWRTILVSVLGGPARLITPQGPALGAAMLAAQTIGLITDRARPRGTLVAARATWIDRYDQVYASYGEAAQRLAPISHELVATGAAERRRRV
jgi:xylulokinase